MPSSRSRDVGLFLLIFAIGAGAAVYLHWPALTSYGVYNTDIRQSPHWAAYHTTSFQADDPILEYARHNESPLQNAIYFVATWFVDYIPLTKYLAVVSYGLAGCLFFFVGRAMYTAQAGALMTLFFLFFSDNFEYSAGFFSKFWAIPSLLLCVYLLRSECWRGLLLLMPFAALAYPMIPLVVGLTCAIYCVMLWFDDRPRAWALFRWLAIASALAVSILLWKYLTPLEFIGRMIERETLLEILAKRQSHYVPIPSVVAELSGHLNSVFVIVSALGYLLVLGWRKVSWERCWSALFLASSLLYVLADVVFPRLYIPNRYTRYSIALILVLWHATNWDRVLRKVPRRAWRHAAVAGLLAAGALAFQGTFEQGMATVGATRRVALGSFIRTLPEGVLIAGPPRYLDDIMIMGRRSVLVTFKLNHAWYDRHRRDLRERELAVFRAIYAQDSGAINELHERYGVTHLVCGGSYYESKLRRQRYDSRHNALIRDEIIGDRKRFLLEFPSLDWIVYRDGRYFVLELPLPEAEVDGPEDRPR